METINYWQENGHSVNYNSNDGFGRVAEQLNFAAAPSEDEAEYPTGAFLKKGKVSRQDPMSHRIIEKRRRDRMNNCLADLSRLIPPEYLKKGRGRVEKTEIIEMAIRHLKYLQERANGVYNGNDLRNAGERQGADHFRAGYQEASNEAVRYLVEMQGYGSGEGLCGQLSSHLQRHCELVTKGESLPREKIRMHPGSSSETASSSSSSHGFVVKTGVITTAPPSGPAPYPADGYDPDRPPDHYHMECEGTPLPLNGVNGVSTPAESDERLSPPPQSQPQPQTQALDTPRRETTLRAVRKPEHTDDYLHSYKFKNSIERRFSRSQDTEAAEAAAARGKTYTHKRRRAAKPTPSTSTSASASTEEARDTSPQDTSSESPHHHHAYEKPPPPPAQFVPVFALNTIGKYYVPLSVEYACVARQLGECGVLGARSPRGAPLHPVTIHVNFQPCLDYHVKREPADRDWRAA